jgi:hypothetical protein
MTESYEADFTEMKGSEKGTKRYITLRAIANGADSYNSIFTPKARESIVSQMRGSSVKMKMLHKDAVMSNVRTYLESKMKDESERPLIEKLLGQLPMADFPFATAMDARFTGDNEIEVTAEVNDELSDIPGEKEKMDAYWNLIQNKKITGASIVFSNVKSFQANGKTYIDDLYVQGLDIVDRPAHTRTRIVDTFMRAATDAIVSEPAPMEMKMADVDFKKVEEIVDQRINSVQEQAAKKAAEEQKLKDTQSKFELQIAELQKQLQEKDSALNEYQTVTAEAAKVIQTFRNTKPVIAGGMAPSAVPQPKETMAQLFKLRDQVKSN